MTWWIWLAIGIIIICAEIFIPLDFFLIFIGLAFVTTGALVHFDVVTANWAQWTTCAVLSVVFYLGLKQKLAMAFSRNPTDRPADYVGETIQILSDLAPGEVGKGSLRGTHWQVKNDSSVTLKANSNHPVKKTDGILLIIE